MRGRSRGANWGVSVLQEHFLNSAAFTNPIIMTTRTLWNSEFTSQNVAMTSGSVISVWERPDVGQQRDSRDLDLSSRVLAN